MEIVLAVLMRLKVEMYFHLNCRANLIYVVVFVRKREKSVNDSMVVLRT